MNRVLVVDLCVDWRRGLAPSFVRGSSQVIPGRPGQVLVGFDGRIDNRAELGRRLGRSVPVSDLELFAECWGRWGSEAARVVVGEFAALVWDEPSQVLTAVRDPLGHRVLYWHHDGERCVVASTPSLIHRCGVRREVDPVKVADGLLLNYADGARSWFRGVHRLLPGHSLTVTPDRVSVTEYHDVLDVEPLVLGSDDEYLEAARSVLHDATGDLLAGVDDPSIMLSSGLDSPMVALAALPILRQRGGTLHAYTSVPQERWRPRAGWTACGDEGPAVRAFLDKHPEIQHTFVRAEHRGVLDHLDGVIDAADAPPRNASNLFWIHEIHRLTAERGSSVLLSGGFGNASLGFSGFSLLDELAHDRRWSDLARELRSTPASKVPVLQPLVTELLLPRAPRSLWRRWARWRGQPADWRDYSAIRADAAGPALHRAAGFGVDVEYRPPRTRIDWYRALLGNAATELADVHRAFRAMHGVEIRDPTFDRRVVELAVSLPTDQYRRDGQDRWLQHRLLGDQIPEVMRRGTRGKQAADVRVRMGDELDRLHDDVQEFADHDTLSELVDLDRLAEALADDAWWTADQDHPDQDGTLLAVPRAIAIGRFVQHATDPPGVVARVDTRQPVAVEASAAATSELDAPGAAMTTAAATMAEAFAALALDGGPAVEVLESRVGASLAAASSETEWFDVADRRLLLRFPNGLRVLVEDGCRMVIDRPPGLSDDELSLWVLGTAWGGLVHQRGLLPLHASAVEIGPGRLVGITGASGAGKSTMAAALVQQGCRLAADDTCAVFVADGQVLALPGHKRPKLWDDSAERLGLVHRTPVLERDGRTKSFVDDVPMSAPELSALTRLLVIDNGPDPAVEPIRGGAAVLALRRSVYRPVLGEAVAGRSALFERLAGVAGVVPVATLTRPRSLSRLADVARWLLPLLPDLQHRAVPADL